MKTPASRHVFDEIWYGDSAAASVARAAMAPLSLLFGVGVGVRGFLYDHGLIALRRAGAPVISVGGLSVGGSGKTPFVLWLAARLRERGLRPCIVTRGYGAEAPGDAPLLVTAEAAGDPRMLARAGDEAVLLALRSGCPVAVGRDRVAACEMALRDLPAAHQKPHLFVLDDGFQHRGLARDVDIVVVDGGEEERRLLPAGPLRERPSALARADAVVVMGRSAGFPAGGEPPAAAAGRRAAGAAMVLNGVARPTLLVSNVIDLDGETPAALAGRRVVAVAAIARPERFLDDLARAGAKVVATVLRRDHHRYDDRDRREIEAAASGADLVVTTEKDLVKLVATGEASPIRALRIEMDVEAADPLLDRARALVPFDR